jgi:hypothetical protein
VDCTQFSNGCFSFGEYFIARDVQYNAFLIHRFAPFVTIANRVQIGINAGGGVGSFSGTLERHDVNVEFVAFNPVTGRAIGRQAAEVVTFIEPDEEIFTPWPIGKVQLAGAVLVAPGFKIRVGGGIDFPGTSAFSISGLYLFGSN